MEKKIDWETRVIDGQRYERRREDGVPDGPIFFPAEQPRGELVCECGQRTFRVVHEAYETCVLCESCGREEVVHSG